MNRPILIILFLSIILLVTSIISILPRKSSESFFAPSSTKGASISSTASPKKPLNTVSKSIKISK